MKRMKTSILLSVVLCLGIAGPAAAAPPTCPPSFEAAQFLDADGNLIMSSVAMFPSILRAFEDEIYSPEGFAADVAALDKNDNGVFCAIDIWELNGGRGAPPSPEQAQGLGGFYYFIHGIDDKA